MLATKIRIRGVKSIDRLDVFLESGINLLYGPNGIGKSTVLEALSLLGHLQHMPIAMLDHESFVMKFGEEQNVLSE